MADDADALPKFTSDTPNPRSGADYSGKDEPITRPVLPHEYTDMRGNHWLVQWTGKMWTSTPTTQTVEAYKEYTMEDGSPLVRKGMFSAASTAADMVESIEGRIEAARVRGLKKPFPWWLVALGVAAYLHSKKGRRR